MSTVVASASAQLSRADREFVDKVISEQDGRPGALLTILEKVQERNPQKYLPPEVLEYVAERTDLPLAQIHSVVTFYALFNTEPQGKNTICICRGTACHTRGSRNLLERLRLDLGLNASDNADEDSADKIALTTPDGKYTMRTVACFGQCALAPVVEVNHNIFGHMNERTLQREVEALEQGKKK